MAQQLPQPILLFSFLFYWELLVIADYKADVKVWEEHYTEALFLV